MTDQGKKLAFWGKVSTEDNQDPESSRGWQLTRARTLIEPHGGQIVAEFFDIDKSRSIPPQRRPQASALLAALADPSRGFEAVVVGEPQRAFYGNQFGNTFPIFAHYGVPLWVPEVGGPIDPDNEAHDLIMSVFGGVSKGERNRIKIRVRTAMAAQAQLEGRFLGGRPPYGYRLIDAGPHPNPAKAADGKRLHALAPDPNTADVVSRIFAEYLSGAGLKAIAESLTRDGIPSPVRLRPGAQPAPLRHRLVLGRGRRDPRQSPVHRPPGVEPAAQRRGTPRRGRRRAGTCHQDAVERARQVDLVGADRARAPNRYGHLRAGPVAAPGSRRHWAARSPPHPAPVLAAGAAVLRHL